MEALALSIDEQNAEDWGPTPECKEEQQTSGQDQGNSDLTELSLEDTIRKYIPDGSHPALSLKQRKSSLWFVEDDGVAWPPIENLDFEVIDRYRAPLKLLGRSSVLAIHDINLDWCQALRARYRAALHPELLAGHIIRFDEISSAQGDAQDIELDLLIRYPDAKIMAYSSNNFIAVQMTGSGESVTFTAGESAFRLGVTFQASRGKAHERLVDLYRSAAMLRDVPFRQDRFEKDEFNRWRRISACITCFRLEADFYLILFDTPAVPTVNGVEGYHPGTFRIEDGLFSKAQKLLPNSTNTMHSEYWLDNIVTLFRRHTMQSVFHPRSLSGWRRPQPQYHRMDPKIFTWLLVESNWRVSVTQLESKLQQLRREATTIAGDQAFAGLTDLRRQIADAYVMLAETREAVDNALKASYIVWNVDGKDLSAEEFWSEQRGQLGQSVTMIQYRAQSIDIRDLPIMLEEFLERIKAMTQTVNEEIQMVIGSVQVEDARVMRRQTEWTVVLAVLAAIYLPMTLVTGIFGMNITEIGDDITAPDRWSVVKAWGIVFGATMGSVLVYAVARYVLRYRRVGRMLLRRKMRNIGDGWLYRKGFAFKNRLQQLWLYRKIHGFREKMREWDVEAQKMEKRE